MGNSESLDVDSKLITQSHPVGVKESIAERRDSELYSQKQQLDTFCRCAFFGRVWTSVYWVIRQPKDFWVPISAKMLIPHVPSWAPQWNAGGSSTKVSDPEKRVENEQRFWRSAWLGGLIMKNNPLGEPEKACYLLSHTENIPNSLPLENSNSTSFKLQGLFPSQFSPSSPGTCCQRSTVCLQGLSTRPSSRITVMNKEFQTLKLPWISQVILLNFKQHIVSSSNI